MTYILWDVDAEIFSIGAFTLRWNALLILLAYLAGRLLLSYIYTKQGLSRKDIVPLITYLLIVSLITARLAYVILEMPQLFWTNPLQVIFPISMEPSFRFTSSFGLNIYGAAGGVILACWLYSRKRGNNHTILQVLDRTSLVSALTAFFLFTGTILSSQTAGEVTESSSASVVIQPVTKGLMKIPCCIMRNPNGKNPLDLVVAKKDHTLPEGDSIHRNVILYLFFKPGATEQLVNEFLIGDVKTFLFDMSRYVYEPGTEPLHYSIIAARDGNYIGRVQTKALSRIPVEAIGGIFSLCLFIVLFFLWKKGRTSLQSGKLFGYFMILFWSMHLLVGLFSEGYSTMEITLDILFLCMGIIGPHFLTRKKFTQMEKQGN